MNIEYENSNDSWSLIDMGWSVLAAQHHNGMNVGLLVNDGDRFCAAVNAVSPALPDTAWAWSFWGFEKLQDNLDIQSHLKYFRHILDTF